MNKVALVCRNGVWSARWHKDGKQVWRSLKTRDKAEAMRIARDLGGVIDKPAVAMGPLSIGDAWAKYKQLFTGKKAASTLTTEGYAWERLQEFLRVKHCVEVTPLMAVEFHSWLAAKGIGHRTCNDYVTNCGTVWNKLLKTGVLAADCPNPFSKVDRFPKEHKDPIWLDAGEINRCLDAAQTANIKLFFALGIFAGFRHSEILAARWDWVKWPTATDVGHIRIPAKQDWFETKNRKSRFVPLSPWLADILSAHKGVPGAYIVAPFCREFTGRNRWDVRVPFRAVIKAAEISKGVTPHKLRHTFASHAAMAGVDMNRVRMWMGHESLETTNIYAHLSPNDAAIERVFAPAVTKTGGG